MGTSSPPCDVTSPVAKTMAPSVALTSSSKSENFFAEDLKF